MGRGVTPVQFNRRFAQLLKAARVAAGYRTQKDGAVALGVEFDAYKKYEQGRTALPHELISRACRAFGKDANYFYDIEPAEQQQRRAG